MRRSLIVCASVLGLAIAATGANAADRSPQSSSARASEKAEATVDLSPDTWPASAREKAEATEFQRWDPATSQVVSGTNGVVSATVSPIAVEAGLQALKKGGNAADAAATVALTQITTQLGSVVSYAGIMTLLYYDAETGKVYSMDAGYNSYKNETDPKSIPTADLGPLNFGSKPAVAGALGRETLVPGFMAGVQALHDHFGNLPFNVLFEPAIAYARKGVKVSSHLARYFNTRKDVLAKSPEGLRFLHQAGNELPKVGDTFVQPELAHTLSEVAEHGANYMYTGAWGKAFVAAVQKRGGKATLDDLENYRAIWNQPYSDKLFGHTVYVNGAPNYAVYEVLSGLNMAEASKLGQRGPYWSDPVTFRGISRIGMLVSGAPYYPMAVAKTLEKKGIDYSRKAQRTKAFGKAVSPVLDELFTPANSHDPHHSNSIVVVDKDGNIAVMTHTINAFAWGGTGIVVGGIPVPDSAGFQQALLAQLEPGDRLPNNIACTLTFLGNKPVLATAPIGTSLVPETIKTILEVIAHKQSLADTVGAPAMLAAPAEAAKPLAEQPITVPQGTYDAKFLDRVRALGASIQEVPEQMATQLRGTLATVAIDPITDRVSAPRVPGVMVFSGAN